MTTKKRKQKIDAPRAWGYEVEGLLLRRTFPTRETYMNVCPVPVVILRLRDFRRLVRLARGKR